MSQFYAKPQAIPRPPGSFGVSGSHFAPPVSPSLDPAAFGEVSAGDRVRQAAASAMDVAQRQANIACTGSRAIHSDPNISPPERHRRALALANDALEKTADHFERARLVNEKETADLAAKTAGPSIEISDVRGAEIRSRIEGRKSADRLAAVVKSINRGDDSVAAAILGTDRVCTSFMSDAEIDFVRSTWAKARFPESVARLEILRSDHQILEQGAAILRSYPTALAGPQVVAARPPPPGHRPQVFGLDV